jgi:hypothetical protein
VFKKILGKLVSLSVIIGMAEMIYFDDFTYTNVFTVYYSLISILYFVTMTICAVFLCAPLDHDKSNVCFDMFTNLSKINSGWSGVINWTLTIASVIMLLMCGYVFIVVVYVASVGAILLVSNAGKDWIVKYNDYQFTKQ